MSIFSFLDYYDFFKNKTLFHTEKAKAPTPQTVNYETKYCLTYTKKQIKVQNLYSSYVCPLKLGLVAGKLT